MLKELARIMHKFSTAAMKSSALPARPASAGAPGLLNVPVEGSRWLTRTPWAAHLCQCGFGFCHPNCSGESLVASHRLAPTLLRDKNLRISLASHFLPIVFAGTLLLQLIGTSCRPRPLEEYSRRLEKTGKVALHAVHSERLRQIMAELERLSLNQLPQEMDVVAERERQIGRMSPVAQAMAEAALHIPDVLKEVELSDEKQQVFIELAEKLGDQAVELHRQAERRSLIGVSQTLESIGDTCSACHGAFRVLPVATEPAP